MQINHVLDQFVGLIYSICEALSIEGLKDGLKFNFCEENQATNWAK